MYALISGGLQLLFTIVDIETGGVRVVPNNGDHMCGYRPVSGVIAEGKCPNHYRRKSWPKAVQIFRQSGIEVFTGARGTVQEAIEDRKAGRLAEADAKNAC